MNAFCCYVVFVFQDAEQQVLSADDAALENLRLEVGDLQNLFGLLHQGNVPRSTWFGRTRAHRAFHQLAQLLKVAIEPLEDADGRAFTFFDDAQKEVFHTDVIVSQTKRLFTTE